MKQYSYIIKTIDPVTFAEKSNDQILYATKQYIPGSAIRGALANKYIVAKGLGKEAHEDSRFFEMFLSGKVRFLSAYPIGDLQMQKCCPITMPLSLMKSKDGSRILDLTSGCKIEPGFKKLQGFGVMDNEQNIHPVSVDTKIEFHMSRCNSDERISGKSINGNVFNYEYIMPNQYFKGYFVVDDDLSDGWEAFWADKNLEEIYLGRSKNAQYGKCQYMGLGEEITNDALLTEKMFITSVTPYVPYEPWQSVEQLFHEMLLELEDKLDGKVKFSRANCRVYAATENIDGFVGVWHTKKQRETALSAGSVIELKLEEGRLDTETLNRALMQGLGKNTVEGFGQFRVWNPLPENFKFVKSISLREKNELSAAVKVKAREIIHNLILREVRQEAANSAGDNRLVLGKDYKNVCKRIEGLMRSGLSKLAIQETIARDFKNKTVDNLHDMKYDKAPMYSILLELDNHKQIYNGISWENRLGLGKEQLRALREDLGSDAFNVSEDDVFKEFWLWFMRHAVRK